MQRVRCPIGARGSWAACDGNVVVEAHPEAPSVAAELGFGARGNLLDPRRSSRGPCEVEHREGAAQVEGKAKLLIDPELRCEAQLHLPPRAGAAQQRASSAAQRRSEVLSGSAARAERSALPGW